NGQSDMSLPYVIENRAYRVVDTLSELLHSDAVHALDVAGNGGDQMKIRWLGHACFLITNGNGVRIITDPYAVGGGIEFLGKLEELGNEEQALQEVERSVVHQQSDLA
ncbi:MAG: MBL fold metallo-hydrolase, partial [Candidatus Hydrogenedentota bacterium]